MYYQLKPQTGRARHDRSVLCASRTLDIGQTPSCTLLQPDDAAHEPALFASIVPLESGQGWCIVRRCDWADIRLDGEQLGITAPLKHGQTLAFGTPAGERSFAFSVHHDGTYDEAQGIVTRSLPTHRSAWWAAALALVATGVSLWVWLAGRGTDDSMAGYDFDQYAPSIYHIQADSVYLMRDTVVGGRHQSLVVRAAELDAPTAGTCFLTDDGLFVTARHCVEPWITDEEWDGVALNAQLSPAVRMAVEAETANMLAGTDVMHVRAHCVVSRGMERYEFYSTDFIINRQRDQIVCLGTDRHPLYWRNIFPVATRRDMELGDMAYVASPGLRGTITLARLDDLRAFDRQPDKRIAVLGYPVSDAGTADYISHVYGNSQHLTYTPDSSALDACIAMSAAINKGNSGGPVMARVGKRMMAVGIVSKGDASATQGTFWAVPASEVSELHARGDSLPVEQVRFRR